MATMLRPKGLGKKIAYAILGKPANLTFKPNERQRQINRRLLSEETIRSR